MLWLPNGGILNKSSLSSTIMSWLSTVSSFSYMPYLFLMEGFMNYYFNQFVIILYYLLFWHSNCSRCLPGTSCKIFHIILQWSQVWLEFILWEDLLCIIQLIIITLFRIFIWFLITCKVYSLSTPSKFNYMFLKFVVIFLYF